MAVALIAVVVAIGAWFRPIPKPETPAAKTFSEQEISDAKKAVCDAFDRGQKTLNISGNKSATTPTDSFVIAVNTRVTINTIIVYWRSTLQQKPAASTELQGDVNAVADLYQNILLTLLSDGSRSDLDALYAMVDGSVSKVTQACK